MIAAVTGNGAVMLLLGAAAAWYVASRLAASALAGGRAVAAGRRALGHWLPVVSVTVAALLMRRPEVAIGAIFASSVACLTLAMGVTIVSARGEVVEARRRSWCFVLPAALIALLIGFRAQLGWMQAAILALEGLALGQMWRSEDGGLEREGDADTERRVDAASLAGLLVVAVLLGAVGAWAGVVATLGISAERYLPGGGLITAVMVGPALALPMIGAGAALAHEGRSEEAISAQVGVVLLNLCALLPVAVVVWELMGFSPAAAGEPLAMLRALADDPRPLPYPLGVWRVDTVLLVALGFLLLPVGLGRWKLGRAEGYGLLVAYAIYMVMTAAVMM